jgi:hypothetical protein
MAFDGRPKMRDVPGKFSTKELLEQVEKLKDVRPRKHPAPPPRKRKRGEDSGPKIFSRKALLWMLLYWNDLLLPYNLDVTHIEKNICENILGTLLEIQSKTKDTDNARLDLQDMDIRHDLHLQQDGNSVMKPDAPYILTKENKLKFCKCLKGVKFLDGFAANLGRFISVDGTKL